MGWEMGWGLRVGGKGWVERGGWTGKRGGTWHISEVYMPLEVITQQAARVQAASQVVGHKEIYSDTPYTSLFV